MRLFSKTSETPGWMAVAFHADGIAAVHVQSAPATAPVVDWVAFYPGDKSSVAQSLEKLVKDLDVSRHRCTSVLGGGDYQLLSVDAPNVPLDELKTAMRWRLKDVLDYHIDDATFDVLAVPADKNAAVRAQSMYVVAARNQLIEERQALFEKAKISLRVIDIPEMAQRNIAALLEPEGRGLALLSFDAAGGLLTLTFGGELHLARRIDVTLAQIMQVAEAERDAMHDRITLELQRSFDHFDRQYRHITLSKLVLAPLGAAALPMQTYLAGNLYVPVELLDLADIFDISKVPQLKQVETQQRHFLTLGAALRREEVAL